MLAMYHRCLFLGAGIIYVWNSNGSAVSHSCGLQGPQPSNSCALVDVGIGLSRNRLSMSCCSNNTYPDASFTYPDGHVSAGSYWNSRVGRYTGSSYAGCYYFYHVSTNLHGYSFGSNGYDGIYTCNITDSRGTNLNLNSGLYDEGFSSESSILISMYSSTKTCSSNSQPLLSSEH